MTPFTRPDRRCPKCGHKGYTFRARKTIDAPEAEVGKQVQTKYRCRACSHEWRERVPAPPEPPKSESGRGAV
ncbi:MAG TPA: hypothetical protein VH092_16535 [Urbifossiella sp.]|jgi:DNA-directed RNA polymerase subunit M/transcription elongation factor TFIIS|nr:hypothetical protein [Urbifossiella sp.]